MRTAPLHGYHAPVGQSEERAWKVKTKSIVAMLAGALTLVLAAGVAWAETINCENGVTELCLGTIRADTINGTIGNDRILALGGADLVKADEGSDEIQGGIGEDMVQGNGASDESVWGGERKEGMDASYPDKSDDEAYGGKGNDFVYGGYAQGGVDRVFGGRGNDYVQTYQRGLATELGVKITREIVDCGPGDEDVVYFDKDLDTVKNCEERRPVRPGGGGAPEVATVQGANHSVPSPPFE